MIKNIKKILIYGKNFHARAAFRKLYSRASEFEIIGFIENSNNITSINFFDKTVYQTSNLNQIDFDQIVVAGRYISEMKEIILASGVPENKIWEMKRSEFQPSTQELSKRSDETKANLKFLLKILNDQKVDYWFVASSLLALKREQDLAWFADVDIAIPFEKLDAICSVIEATNFFYSIEVSRHLTSGKLWSAGNIYQIVIKSGPSLKQSEPAVIDIHALHRFKNKVYYNLTDSSFLNVSDVHFSGKKKIKYGDLSLNIPIQADKYLSSTYGDQWVTPVEFFNVQDHIGRVNL